MSSRRKRIDELSHEIMSMVEPHGPEDALEALELAIGSAIICSTETQLKAIAHLQETTERLLEMIDEYPTYTQCHWEHEE